MRIAETCLEALTMQAAAHRRPTLTTKELIEDLR
ncbi:hypothetical protein predicted by Glimmer/Critica (plasmid) [Sinorhizobium fredii HH103]|uniref:Uncharacterized protein n=1 Tax=Sinorhizobium fredii (strain HH103) TaxID=1117943 RepID=G9AIU7_SINF1|nr:hypothetical protein predicted by Glimmer/Critica [Sinorhizobium fredii HH103]